ncbi:unnamed protein product [Nesidiocoris tenuis]|uniref:Peptidase S1 domain-containing protein n=1 Tax=Nesidiocoris tenuis TaxID=355587 RepID=A0A6H5GWG4_9HEMI|nr:unnamed protein product [Nesidiocoris tenuis]
MKSVLILSLIAAAWAVPQFSHLQYTSDEQSSAEEGKGGGAKSTNCSCGWTNKGDSGGPLIWLDPETNLYTQVALVSYGKACASYAPAVNTDVAHFMPWIQAKIARKPAATEYFEKEARLPTKTTTGTFPTMDMVHDFRMLLMYWEKSNVLRNNGIRPGKSYFFSNCIYQPIQIRTSTSRSKSTLRSTPTSRSKSTSRSTSTSRSNSTSRSKSTSRSTPKFRSNSTWRSKSTSRSTSTLRSKSTSSSNSTSRST